MVQPSEIIIFCQLIVDTIFYLWYDKYVGAALGCSFLRPSPGQQKTPLRAPATQKKWPLTVCSFRTSFSVKGHFCSFLLSNIIGYLAFVDLDFCLFIDLISFPLSDFKNHLAWSHLLIKSWFFTASQLFGFDFWSFSGFCPFLIPDVRGIFFWSVDGSPDLNDSSFFWFRLYLLFHPLSGLPLAYTGFCLKDSSLFDSFEVFILILFLIFVSYGFPSLRFFIF